VACGPLRDDPRTVVLVSHDVEEALYLSDRVAVLFGSAGANRPPSCERRGRGRSIATAPSPTRLSSRPRGSDAGAAEGMR